jgi:2-C-methyl-D-erythritol 2,4-cyclodiphosphate synthase
MRVGLGVDFHRFCDGRPLRLGGVEVAHPRGLAGHSDADVLLHAIADALLGAASMGDIGVLFPDTDERWRGADSGDLLAEVCRKVRAKGFDVENVDSVVICEKPKIAPHRAAMIARIAAALGVPPDRVSVKATTSEGMGPTGRGEGIEARAIALLS